MFNSVILIIEKKAEMLFASKNPNTRDLIRVMVRAVFNGNMIRFPIFIMIKSINTWNYKLAIKFLHNFLNILDTGLFVQYM